MTFLDRYTSEITWHGKVMVMEIYHLAQTSRNKSWTIKNTARYFQCSMGLVSENLHLAKQIHITPELMRCETRQEALKKL